MILKLVLIISLALTILTAQPIVKCNQTLLTYLSSFALGQQHDLNKTFQTLKSTVKVPNFSYTPRVGKTYTIEDIALSFFIINSKQKSTYVGVNKQRIYGSVLKLSYNFTWEKKQLGASVRGTANGVVLSDPLDFTKQIGVISGEPDETLAEYKNVTFTNSFPVSNVKPFNENDSSTLALMMNEAVLHEPGKDIIAKAINEHFATVLNETIFNDSSELSVETNFTYRYFDYRGEFKIEFDNPVILIEMYNDGTTLLSSQVITDDPLFQCGPEIPSKPKDEDTFGGKQNMLSNSVLKSSVRYILNKGYFNIRLNQEQWESRAFQFFAGDLYIAIPSLKKVAADTKVAGQCSAAYDDAFNFSMKSSDQYQLTLNFSCFLNMSNTTIVKLNMVTTNIINVTLQTKQLRFTIHSITGTPKFEEIEGYKIENLDFAKFLVTETLRTAKGAPTFGTGYKTNQREHPYVTVEKDYLFMYDPSYIPHSSARARRS